MALRTPLSVTPHLYMGDSTGRPLDKGVVYFGEQDKDPEFYPINLFSDDALTKPLAQPVHTKGGYLYDKGDMVEPHAKELIYSVKVLDSYGRKVFYKGAMMRNSWNDDVIEQINTAIIGSADAARQVAIDITNDAINNTVIENGVVTADLVVAEGGQTQRQLNSRITRNYRSVADMVSDNSLRAGNTVSTSGFYQPNDYGGANYHIETRSNADARGVRYWQSGSYNAHYAFLISPNLVAEIEKDSEYRLEQFGAKGDGIYDCYDAFITALNLHPYGKGYYQSSPTIKLLSGETYFVSKRINIKRSVKISGEASGMATGSPAIVKFPAGVTGFIINRYNTYDNGVESTPTTAGDSTTLEGFLLQGSRGTPDVCGGHGIRMRARALIKNMLIDGFEGNGIHIFASANGNPDFVGNTNNFMVSDCRISKNNIGIFVRGADSNAGTVSGVDSSSNRVAGFYDASFLGNQWVNCHAAGNGRDIAYAKYDGKYYQANVQATEADYVNTIPGTNDAVWIPNIKQTTYAKDWQQNMPVGSYKAGGAYVVDGLNNRSTFTGCYSEGGQGVVQGNAFHSIFLGGFLVETPVYGRSSWAWSEFGYFKSRSGFATEEIVNGIGSAVKIGGNPANRQYITFTEDGARNDLWYIKGDGAEGLAFAYKNTAGWPLIVKKDGVRITSLVQGSGSTEASMSAVSWTSASGPKEPTSGYYKAGSRIYTHRPVEGQPLGYVCTVSGDAGSTAVFKPFGYVGTIPTTTTGI